MIKKTLFFFSFLTTITTSPAPQNSDRYFDTTFLKQYDSVAQELILHEGFETGFFKTNDDIQLNYLWKKQPNARCTIICCAGFWPGRKEGLATFYSLLPSDCNLFLFDGRGRGKSTGWYYSLWRYGIQEYKDVLAAIQFAEQNDTCPIIVYGVCAGAFHAAHALVHSQSPRVRGLIFDSGWSRLNDAIYTGLSAEFKKKLTSILKKNISYPLVKSMMMRLGIGAFKLTAHCCHMLILKPVISRYQHHTNLLPKIGQISVPIFYIHSYDDDYIDIMGAQQLAQKSQKPLCWWIEEPSSHALHHLKHTDEYRKKIEYFLQKALPSERSYPT